MYLVVSCPLNCCRAAPRHKSSQTCGHGLLAHHPDCLQARADKAGTDTSHTAEDAPEPLGEALAHADDPLSQAAGELIEADVDTDQQNKLSQLLLLLLAPRAQTEGIKLGGVCHWSWPCVREADFHVSGVRQAPWHVLPFTL
jgi:hypothetical protein